MKIYALIAVLPAFLGCSWLNTDHEPDGREVLYSTADVSELLPLNPISSIHGTASSLHQLVTDRIVNDYYGENLLAESIETSDAKTWRIRLRNDVLFHDGSKLTARDVIHSMDLARFHSGRDIWRDRFASVRSVKELSPYEIEIVLSEPIVPFRTYLTFGVLPAHLFPAARFNEKSFLETPVGSGPYRLIRYDSRHAEFERFDRYFRGMPKIKRVQIVSIPTKEEAWTRFARGEFDLMWDNFTDVEQLSHISKSVRSIVVEPPYGYMLALTAQSGFLADVNIRRAVAFAIRRDEFGTLSKYIRGPFPEWMPEGKAWLPAPLSFDPSRSRALLDAAGWKQVSASSARRKGGRELAFPLFYYRYDELSLRVARAIARDLFDVGIRVHLVPDTDDGAPEKMRKSREGALLDFFPPYHDPDRLRDFFHSSRMKNGFNYSGYASRELDRLLDGARKEINPALRQKMYKNAVEHVRDHAPALFLFWRNRALPMDACWQDVSIRSGNFLGSLWRWHCDTPR